MILPQAPPKLGGGDDRAGGNHLELWWGWGAMGRGVGATMGSLTPPGCGHPHQGLGGWYARVTGGLGQIGLGPVRYVGVLGAGCVGSSSNTQYATAAMPWGYPIVTLTLPRGT